MFLKRFETLTFNENFFDLLENVVLKFNREVLKSKSS